MSPVPSEVQWYFRNVILQRHKVSTDTSTLLIVGLKGSESGRAGKN